MEKMDCEPVGRRMGCSCRGRPCQGVRGAWQREQETGDECHPRGARFLNAASYCSSHSRDQPDSATSMH